VGGRLLRRRGIDRDHQHGAMGASPGAGAAKRRVRWTGDPRTVQEGDRRGRRHIRAERHRCFDVLHVVVADTLGALEQLLPWLGPVKRAQLRRAGEVAWRTVQSGQRPIGPRSVQRRANFERFGRLLIACNTTVSSHELDGTSDAGRAWVAGLFDGDGCISFCVTRRNGTVAPKSLRASIAQSDALGQPWVLSRVQRIVGFGTIYGPSTPEPRCLPEHMSGSCRTDHRSASSCRC
jgi:hypothetical protein